MGDRKEYYRKYSERRWGTGAIPLKYFCEICKHKNRGTVRHHIIPRSVGGSNDATNLIEVCRNHHNELETLYNMSEPFRRKIQDIQPNERRSYIIHNFKEWHKEFIKIEKELEKEIEKFEKLVPSRITLMEESDGTYIEKKGKMEKLYPSTCVVIPDLRAEPRSARKSIRGMKFIDGKLEMIKLPMFVTRKNVDEVWEKIRKATRDGELTYRAEVTTCLPVIWRHGIIPYSGMHTIWIYFDKRILKETMPKIKKKLREMGIKNRLHVKYYLSPHMDMLNLLPLYLKLRQRPSG
jgi:hypothetical protein